MCFHNYRKYVLLQDYIACLNQGVQCREVFVIISFLYFLKLFFFSFVFAIFDLVHDMKTIFHLP